MSVIAEGTKVKIVDVGEKDSFFYEKENVIGAVAEVIDLVPVPSDPQWLMGVAKVKFPENSRWGELDERIGMFASIKVEVI